MQKTKREGAALGTCGDLWSRMIPSSRAYLSALSPDRFLARRRLRRSRQRLDELTARILQLHEPAHRGDRPPDVIDNLPDMHHSDPSLMPETDLDIAVLEPMWTPIVILAHHLEEFFAEPGQFDIDRFPPPRDEHRQSGAYMPYGVGTHRCLVEHLAEFVALTAGTLLHDVDVALHPSGYTLKDSNIKKLPSRRPDKSFRFRLAGGRSTPNG